MAMHERHQGPGRFPHDGLSAALGIAATAGIAVLGFCSCAHDRPACRIAVVPEATNGGGAPQSPDVETSCERVAADDLRKLVPSDSRPLDSQARAAWAARLDEAASKYYGDDVAAGTEGLLACYREVRDRPDLLPTSPSDRARTYALLLAVFRLEATRDAAAGDEVATWLAIHMPDMEPSVRYLPPALADRAQQVARNVGPHVDLVTPAPECEGDWLLMVDGMALLPAARSPLPPGEHAVWYECGPLRSWVRRIRLTEELHLDRPDLPLEGMLLPGAPAPTARDDLPAELKGRMAADLARKTGSTGVLLVPHKGDALLVSPDGQSRPVRPDRGRYLLDDPTIPSDPVSSMAVARWVLLPSAALFLAGGVASNLYYNHQMDRMDQGTLDLRSDADAWRYTAIGGYAAASATFTTAVLLFLLDSGD